MLGSHVVRVEVQIDFVLDAYIGGKEGSKSRTSAYLLLYQRTGNVLTNSLNYIIKRQLLKLSIQQFPFLILENHSRSVYLSAIENYQSYRVCISTERSISSNKSKNCLHHLALCPP